MTQETVVGRPRPLARRLPAWTGALLILALLVSAQAADFQAGMAAYKRGDYAAALREFRPLAEQGHAWAQNSLGFMYDTGAGVTEDDAEAVKWYRLAAEQGVASAQFNLGFMYVSGAGVPQDDAEAVKWFRKAAEQGHVKAQNNLGFMYDTGVGVPQDDAEAVKWYRLAAEQGHVKAQINLGFMYLSGAGVPQDDAEAANWYRLAAEQGHDGAQKALKAELVEKGLELSPSDRRLIQMGLVAEGFDPGPADGLFGPRTRKTIRRWQTSRQEAPTGYLDTESAKTLLAAAGKGEVRENPQHQAATVGRRGREKQAAKAIWRCFAMSDYNKTTALFTLTRVRGSNGDFGEVSVAGTTHLASFEIAGLNRRWDFGYDEIKESYLYAFVIEPDGTGLYLDFSTSSDGTAKPRNLFKCLMSP